jgi:hypothetical protein
MLDLDPITGPERLCGAHFSGLARLAGIRPESSLEVRRDA